MVATPPRFLLASWRPHALAFLAVLALGATLGPQTQATQAGFVSQTLAAGVHLLRPLSGAAERTNALVVERDDGLLVVDSQGSPQAARELRAAIRAVSPGPVRYLVLGHAHAESAGGASAFPDAALVIASRGTRDALRDPRFDFGGELRAGSPDPRSWQPPEIRLPGLVIHARTELTDARNDLELLPLSRAHTTGDLLVRLPGPNILYVGALLATDGNPYAADADVEGWLGALNYIARLAPAVVVPLRGEAVDLRAVHAQRDALAWLRGQVQIGFIDGHPAERIAERIVGSEEFGRHFDADASPPFVRTLVDKTVEEALAARRKRGIAR